MSQQKLSPTYCDLKQLEYYAIYLAQKCNFYISDCYSRDKLEKYEIIDCATMGYVKARLKFDPKRGAFSTILYRCIFSEMTARLQHKQRLKNKFIKYCGKIHDNKRFIPHAYDIPYIDFYDTIEQIKNRTDRQIIVYFFLKYKTLRQIVLLVKKDSKYVAQIVQDFSKKYWGIAKVYSYKKT